MKGKVSRILVSVILILGFLHKFIIFVQMIPHTCAYFSPEDMLEFEESNIDILIDEAKKLPVEYFIDDLQLNQHVDHVNMITRYKFKSTSSSENEVVYERKNAIDTGKAVVVLTSLEDHLTAVIRKRTYVVLRQNPITNKSYFAAYAYIRPFKDAAADCPEWDGEKRCIEWDTWDNSRGVIKSKAKYFGWTNCAYSFLASCTFNESHAEDIRDTMKPSDQHEGSEDNSKMKNQFHFDPCPEFEVDDSIDVFSDLDVDIAEAQYIGKAIRFSGRQGAKALMEKGSRNSQGRSILSENSTIESNMKVAKEIAKIRAISKVESKKIFKGKLRSRKLMIQIRRVSIKRLIHLARESRLGTYWDIIADPSLLKRFLKFRNVGIVISELENVKDILPPPSLIVKESDNIKILQSADEDEVNADELTTAVGNALTKIAGSTEAGRSIGDSSLASALGRSVAEGLLYSTTDLFLFPGWKMQFAYNITENITFVYEKDTFYGFGGCPYKKMEKEDIRLANDSNTLVFLYLTILKTNCTKEVSEYVNHLLDTGYLKADAAVKKQFLIPLELAQIRKLKLNSTEFRKLSSSFELSTFTTTYIEELKLGVYVPRSPDGKLVSRSSYFLVQLGLNLIQNARKKFDAHFIKLCRNLVFSLKYSFTKLLQDFEILQQGCPYCIRDLKINTNDRIYVYGLLEFILRSLRPIEYGESVHRMWNSFFVRNRKYIEYKAGLYM